MGILVRGIHSHIIPGAGRKKKVLGPAILSWSGSLREMFNRFHSLSKDLSNDWRQFFPSETPESSLWRDPPSNRFQCFKTHALRIEALEQALTSDPVADPGKVLWSRVTQIHEIIKELKLDDYRPGAVKQLDVNKYLGCANFQSNCCWKGD